MDSNLIRARALSLVEAALYMNTSDKIKQFIRDLPVIPKDQAPLEENCPICLLPFSEIIKEEEDAAKKSTTQDEEKEKEPEEFGITKLNECGHLFCRKDLAEWIRTLHASCPTCRSQFIPATIINTNTFAEDDASSDGGEYLPPSEGEDDFDAYDDIEYSEPDFWNGSDVESIPLVHLEMEERDAMMQEEWTANPDPVFRGSPDSELDEVVQTGLVEEVGEEDEVDFPPYGGGDPVFVSGFMDDDIIPHQIDSGHMVDDDVGDPDFDEALMAEAEDSEIDPGLMEHEDSDSDDPDYHPDNFSEDLDCESDFNSADEIGAMYSADDDDDTHHLDEEPQDYHEEHEQHSDSEQEELEVEWGLTDGESNSSADSEGEVREHTRHANATDFVLRMKSF